MFEPATNKGLADYLARKERERKGIEFWKAVDAEVEAMKANRIARNRLANSQIDYSPKRVLNASKAIKLDPTKPKKKSTVQIAIEQGNIATVQADVSVCYYCESPGPKTIDHIIPLSKNGPNKGFNLVACCNSCNNLKANYTLEYFKHLLMGNVFTNMSAGRNMRMIVNTQRLIDYRDSEKLFMQIV